MRDALAGTFIRLVHDGTSVPDWFTTQYGALGTLAFSGCSQLASGAQHTSAPPADVVPSAQARQVVRVPFDNAYVPLGHRVQLDEP